MERVGAIQPEEEKALERPESSFQHLKGAERELERDFSQRHGRTGRGGMASN